MERYSITTKILTFAVALEFFLTIERTVITIKSSPYEYITPDAGTMSWHGNWRILSLNRTYNTVNFADSNLFFAYGGPLFAQDEAQVILSYESF